MKIDNLIVSRTNKNYKFLKSLLNKKYRQNSGLFFAEGSKVVFESLEFCRPKIIAISENFEDKNLIGILEKLNIEIYYFPENLFKSLTDTSNSQGIIAYYKDIHRTGLASIKEGRYLYLDQLQDPGNIGTLIRSAIAFKMDGVIFSSGSVEIYNPKLIRATMSSIFKIPIFLLEDENELKKLKEKSFEFLSADLDIKNPSYGYKFSKNFILALGNEANGLSERIKALTDKNIYIPIAEKIESLNVAVAGSIIMYEMARE